MSKLKHLPWLFRNSNRVESVLKFVNRVSLDYFPRLEERKSRKIVAFEFLESFNEQRKIVELFCGKF